MRTSDDGRPTNFEPPQDIEEILLAIREVIYESGTVEFDDQDDLPLMFRSASNGPRRFAALDSQIVPPRLPPVVAEAADLELQWELPIPTLGRHDAGEAAAPPAEAEPPRIMVDCRSSLALRMAQCGLQPAPPDRAIVFAYGPLLPEFAPRQAPVFDGVVGEFAQRLDETGNDGLAELVRPLLKQWVDENMACLVERALCGEAGPDRADRH